MLPPDFAAVQIDGVERAPGRSDGRVAVGVVEDVVAVAAVLEKVGILRGAGRVSRSVFACEQDR